MREPNDERWRAAEAARHAALGSWGPWLPGEGDVYAPLIGGALTGMPAWPTREAFRALSTEHGTLVATDGLSDPFEAGAEVEGLEAFSGHGLELWIESDERASVMDVPATRAFAVVSHLAYQVADLVLTRPKLDRFEVVSMEIYADEVGLDDERWVSEEGTVGVLIGLGAPTRPGRIALAPSDVVYAGVKLLDLAQLAHIRAGGPTARAELIARLRQTPAFWVNRFA